MIEFAKYISEKWNISESLSSSLCEYYNKGYSPFYICHHIPTTASTIEPNQVWEIFDFLEDIEKLSTKKKRLLGLLGKQGDITEALQRRIQICRSEEELEDLLIVYRFSANSKGQIAQQKGLGPLADLIQKQEATTLSIEELAQQYVDTNPSLKTVDDVLSGVRDIITERFAFDTTVREMVRDFSYEDGHLEIIVKAKDDNLFSAYVNKLIPIKDLDKEEFLKLCHAESNKLIKLKVNIQFFRVTELLRQHFISNPDFPGFDFLCSIIDEVWIKHLQPMVERYIKNRLMKEAESWAIQTITRSIENKPDDKKQFTLISLYAVKNTDVSIAITNEEGRLIGASYIDNALGDKTSHRLVHFFSRHKPTHVIIPVDEHLQTLDPVVRSIAEKIGHSFKLIKYRTPNDAVALAESEWMKKENADLEPPIQIALSLALLYLSPLALISKIGTKYFNIHPLQKYISEENLNRILLRKSLGKKLDCGISVSEIAEIIVGLSKPPFTEKKIKEIESEITKKNIQTKTDIASIPGLPEYLYKNIAGFVVITESQNPLDKTLIHPDNFPLVEKAAREIGISIPSLIENPQSLRSFITDNPEIKIFIEKRLIEQLKIAQKYIVTDVETTNKSKRRVKLSEIEEGAVLTGKVTNIKPFGVFVDINAVCDGLIHISQLADVYVESPEQIVSLNDTVTVKVLKVDIKKRRISLTMKNLGIKAPRIAPSQRQLKNLSKHFQNR